MVDLLMQLFKLWDSSDSISSSDDRRRNLMDEWGRLCWQAQIQLLLNPAEKASYLNAIAALSENIYEVYRKHKELTYLRKLLEDLEHLLADREQPTKFQIGLLKSTVAGESKTILYALRSLSVSEDLINVMQFVFKDINTNFPASKRISNYLKAFEFWSTHQKSLTMEQLIEHLIRINFNHPQIIEYIIKFYETAEYPNTPDEQYMMQKSLMEKQRHFEYLNLLSAGTLSYSNSSIITNLLSSIKVDLNFVRQKMQRQLVGVNLRDSIPNPSPSTEAQTMVRKALTKWPSEKSDLVELAYAMYIYMRGRGSQVTIAMLVKWFEDAFGVSLSRYSHRFAEIKMRKSTRPSKFLDTMVNEFLNYVEDSDAFQPGIQV